MTGGYVRDDGAKIIYTSELSDEAAKAFTLLCVSADLFSRDEQGRVRVAPDGTPHPGSEEAARFMVAYYQTYKRPWGDDGATRSTWAKDYRRGIEELVSLGIVEEPKFDRLGDPVTDKHGFPVVGAFHRDRIQRGSVDLKEGVPE